MQFVLAIRHNVVLGILVKKLDRRNRRKEIKKYQKWGKNTQILSTMFTFWTVHTMGIDLF